MMDWTLVLLGLIIALLLVILFFVITLGSGLAGLIKSQEALQKSMQTLSDQMADLEEKYAEMHSDVRKTAQYFVNFAKGKGSKSGAPWYDKF